MADAKAQSEPVSSMMGSASGISRQVFSAWASGTEATLRATLDAQKAALDASVSVAGTAAESEREARQRERSENCCSIIHENGIQFGALLVQVVSSVRESRRTPL